MMSNMPFPKLLAPIPVLFLTQGIRDRQDNTITGAIKQSTQTLIEDVIFREQVEQDTTRAIEITNRIREEQEVPSADDIFTEEDVIDDPVLAVLDNVINGIMNGESLQPHQETVQRYILNQKERAELISNLLLTKDYRRMIRYAQVRDILEKKLLSAAVRQDMNSSELMAFAGMVETNMTKLEQKIQAGSTGISDILALMNRVDYSLHENEASLKNKFNKTTPVGREIVRRIVYKLKKVTS